MSELFDSLNLTTSAGPSSSQQSSSQPSTSKVFWHASPSPGVLRQLANWTPNKSQDSPTLPLCTQAFVGELKKLPGALEAQSPLIARDSAKRKKQQQLVDRSRGASRHVSDPTANRVKTREYINLESSDDDDEEEEQAQAPRRLLLGGVGESSPESTRRRTMDAGNTGRVRQPSSPSQHSSATPRTTPPQLNATDKDATHHPSISSHRRLDRRPPRRRKKESLIAGLGFTDDSGGATDCIKLFEDLQAAIKGMQNASRPSTSDSTENGSAGQDQRPTVTFDQGSSGGVAANGGRLTPRDGMHRSTSAPNTSRPVPRAQQQGMQSQSPQQQQQQRDELLTPNRVFRSVKSDHDVFRPAAHADSKTSTRALQPRPINVPTSEPQAAAETIKPAAASQHSQSSVHDEHKTHQPVQAIPERVESPASKSVSTAAQFIANKTVHATAQPSPVKRSARIEAMQQQQGTSSGGGKKLGVRGPSLLSKSVSPHNKPTAAVTRKVVSAGSNGPTTTTSRTRTTPLPLGMSQARQPGLPRSCSQYAPAASQSAAASQHSTHANPAAPFRPPAIAARVTRNVRTTSPVKGAAALSSAKAAAGQPASSDDSFGDVDDDAAFLALACEFEY